MYKSDRKSYAALASMYPKTYKRRMFLERAFTLGLAAMSANTLLAACNTSPTTSTGSPATSKATSITWNTQYDSIRFAEYFNRTNSDNITVTISRNDYNGVFEQLTTGAPTPDVLSLDIIWIDAFVQNGLVSPLGNLWKKEGINPDDYLPITMQSARSADGEIWTAPFYTDLGLLYYRKDLIQSPPTTWDELVKVAQAVQSAHNIKYGYVWEETGEGLMCNFIEVLSGFGGSVLDQYGKPALNKGNAAVNALHEMLRWIDKGLSPQANSLGYNEEAARNDWAQGNAVFMRNWPYAIAMSNDSIQSPAVVDKFAVAPLPSQARSCIGGWQLVINKHSPNQDAAWKFIKWMLGTDAQQYLARTGSFAVARQEIYNPPLNSYITERNPFFKIFKGIIETGQLRPRSAQYQDMSQKLQNNIGQVLTHQLSPEEGVKNMQQVLEKYFT